MKSILFVCGSALSLAALASSADAQVTLIARYRLDELSGTTLLDSGPNALGGSYAGGFTLGSGGAGAWTATSATFAEASIGRADVPTNTLIGGMTQSVSYSAWFFTTSVQGYRRVFASENSGIGVGLFYDNLLFTTRGVQDFVQPAGIAPLTWYHAAWVFDANLACTFYLNGAAIGSVQGNGPALATNGPYHIAARSPTTELWDGAIDDVQIYQGELSAAEVAWLHQFPGLALYGGVSNHCVAKTNSLGCGPSIRAFGSHNAAVPGGFVVEGTNVRNQKTGLLLYSLLGPNNAPFQGGSLCVAQPFRRTIGGSSGGNPLPGNDCSGVYSIDMAAFAHGLLGGNPSAQLLAIGQRVDAQFWGRDPGFPPPFNSTLTDGLTWTVGP